MNILKSVVVCVAAISISGCDQGLTTSTSNADAVREAITGMTKAEEAAYEKAMVTEAESLANETTAEGQYFKACVFIFKNDFKEARKWTRKSAEQGYLLAQSSLVTFYSSHTRAGKICGPDPIEEYAWRGVLIHRYSNRPDMEDVVPDVLKMQQRLNLTSDELAKAKTLEAEYIEKYSVEP